MHPATPAGDGVTRYPADRPNLSPGCTYLGSAARFPHTDGAFVRTRPCPSGCSGPCRPAWTCATRRLVEPASVAWHAVARAGDVAGKSVLVVGAGPIGALVVAVLKRAGAGEITAVDLHDLPGRAPGSSAPTGRWPPTDGDEIAAVQADVVIESSGTPAAWPVPSGGAARGGRVVMVGLLPTGDQPVPSPWRSPASSSWSESFRFNDEIDEVIAALADGSLVVDPVLTHEYPVADALEAFAVAKDASRVVQGAAAVRRLTGHPTGGVSGSCRCSPGSLRRRPSR